MKRENKLIEARKLINRVYLFDFGGGNLHGLIRDYNLDDCYFARLENWLEVSEAQFAAEQACFDYLKALPYSLRIRACWRFEGDAFVKRMREAYYNRQSDEEWEREFNRKLP